LSSSRTRGARASSSRPPPLALALAGWRQGGDHQGGQDRLAQGVAQGGDAEGAPALSLEIAAHGDHGAVAGKALTEEAQAEERDDQARGA